jgi:CHASE2 domain-containing sensor protein
MAGLSIGCIPTCFTMALPLPEEPGLLPDGKKKKAFFRLIITLLMIDTLAVIGYLVLVYVFGWEGMVPFGLLVVAAVFTGMYFQEGKQKIEQ